MKTVNVIATKKHDDGSIELTCAVPDGTETKKRYAAIRGGITWPTATNPAYAIILGQEYSGIFEQSKTGPPKGKKVLLAELTTSSLNLEDNFFSQIRDLSRKLLCEDFYYAVLPGIDLYDDGFYIDFSAYCRRCTCSARLKAASDTDNVALGVSRIKQDLDRGDLEIPEDAIVHQEVSGFTREDLAESPENLNYAFNALRHVIGSFCRFPPTNSKLIKPPPAKDWRLA